jgi:heme-degrading monooxygenase HmoA
MYGTVAHFFVKPGMESKLAEQIAEFDAIKRRGAKAVYVYRMDNNPNEFYMAVVWDTKENYVANANSPEQNTRYQDYVQTLERAPEWHDGEIVYMNKE